MCTAEATLYWQPSAKRTVLAVARYALTRIVSLSKRDKKREVSSDVVEGKTLIARVRGTTPRTKGFAKRP